MFTRRTLPLAILLVVAMSCLHDEPTVPRSGYQRALAARVAATSNRHFDEAIFVSLAQEVPSFAGFFLDHDGHIVVQVADSGALGLARNAVMSHITTDGLGLPSRFRHRPLLLRHAKYTFTELAQWRDEVSDHILGKIDGVTFDDMDEGLNRVTIGVSRDAPGAQ